MSFYGLPSAASFLIYLILNSLGDTVGDHIDSDHYSTSHRFSIIAMIGRIYNAY